MLHATLDPFFLLLDRESTADSVETQLEALFHISEAVTSEWLTVHITSELMEALADDGVLPLRGDVAQTLDVMGIDEMSGHDVEQVIFGIMQRAQFLQGDLGVEIALCDGMVVRPPLESRERLTALRAAQEETIEMLGLGISAGWEAELGPFVSRSARASELQVAGSLEAVEGSTECALCLGPFAAVLRVVEDFEELLMLSEPVRLLRLLNELADNQENVVKAAVQIAVFQLQRMDAMVRYQDRPPFGMGDRFIGTLRALGVPRSEALAERVLAAVAEAICQRNLRKTHALRLGSGGGSPAVRQGDYIAQRHDVDYEVHLHYWRGPDAFVELASVVTHNDFTIPPLCSNG
ncbi:MULTISPECIES: hypothetical protein [unclassified Knoellia]|uniref:hypothetical protein n=1 Tax=Knoellia altitudinis TaxID=3404795 RepID=UPI0036111BAC